MVKSVYICVNQTSTMKLRSGKATPLGKRSMMKLRSGSIVGHKRVAPPASKIIQGPSGRVKMLERRAKDGDTEWVCEMCKPGVGGGRCEIESCADRDAGPANRPGVSERHTEKTRAKQRRSAASRPAMTTTARVRRCQARRWTPFMARIGEIAMTTRSYPNLTCPAKLSLPCMTAIMGIGACE